MSLPERRIPSWLWLWPVPFIVVAQVVAKAIGEDTYRSWMRSEFGMVEGLTLLFLAGAVVCFFGCFRHRALVRWRYFGAASLLFMLGAFFFAGEEASWGQHWLGFEPPEGIAARNDQGEFNLHNDPLFERILDQPPRLLLTLAALFAGVVAPIVRRRRGLHGRDVRGESPWAWAWPGFECFPAGLLAVTISLPEKVFEAFDRPVPYLIEISAGETKEYGIALFLFMYALGLLLALRQAQSSAPGAEPTPPAPAQ